MNYRSKTEATAFVEELAKAHHDHINPPEVQVHVGTEATQVDIATMYERPEFIDKILPTLEGYFGTHNVKIEDGRNEGGCSSCDHGSAYGVLLTFRPEGT